LTVKHISALTNSRLSEFTTCHPRQWCLEF